MEIFSIVVKFIILFTAFPIIEALTAKECQTESDACVVDFQRAVQQERPTGTICQLARSSLSCVQGLDCRSEMFLRLAYRTTRTWLSRLGNQCELGTYFPQGLLFPLDAASSKDCRRSTEDCTYTYVDLLLAHESQSETANKTLFCQYLDDFAECRLNSESCEVDREKLKMIADDEKERLELSECSLTSLNPAFRTTSSPMLVLSAALTTMMVLRTMLSSWTS